MDKKLTTELERIEKGEYDSAGISHLLDTYYLNVIGKNDEIDDDVLDIDQPYPEEFFLPIEERDSGIGEAVDILLKAGHDINESDDYSSALTKAVSSADVPMVQYLLSQGADANRWPAMKEDSPEMKNWYLDAIDYLLFDESLANDRDKVYMDALFRTAVVLADEAGLGPFSGWCLKVDTENRVVSVKSAEPMY